MGLIRVQFEKAEEAFFRIASKESSDSGEQKP
jgi:hypothetical protein